jgi:peptidoglycan-N-acetylglucosamine deacetylase
MPDVSLTFDNGPSRSVTPRVLDSLGERDIPATFFVVGQHLMDGACQTIARRALAEGHRLGNHTFTHSLPLGLSSDPDIVATEVAATDRLIRDLGETARLFRPFGGGGHLDQRLLRADVVTYLTDNAYSCILWNAVPGDWADPEGWPERAAQQCLGQDWAVLVLHDIPTGAMDRLDDFLDDMKSRGVSFRADFPDECVPIRDGRITAPLDRFVAP